MAGFGDIWGAAGEGAEASQNAVNDYYHSMAMSALTNAYGPMAGDPAAALQAQQYNYLSQQNPQLLQQQALTNTGLGQENAYRGGMLQYQLQGAAGDAAVKTAAGAYATGTVQPSIAAANAQFGATTATALPQATAGLSKAQSEATTLGLGADQATAWSHLGGVSAFTQAANDALSRGLPADQAFAAGVAAAHASGAPYADVEATAAAERDKFMANPSTAIDDLNGQASAVVNAQWAKMPVAARLEAQKNQSEIYNLHLKGVTDAQGIYEKAKAQEDDILAKAGPAGALYQATRDATGNLDEMENMVRSGQIDPSALGRKIKQNFVLDSAEAKYKEYAESVHAALASGQVVAGREIAGGSTGLGRNIAEYNSVGEAISNFDTALDPEQQLGQIANARRQLKILGDSSQVQATHLQAGLPAATATRQRAEGVYHNLLSGMSGSPSGPAAPPAANVSPPGSPSASSGTSSDFYQTANEHESGGRNVAEPSGQSDAFGYYQITGPTWDTIRTENPGLGLPADIHKATQQQQDAGYRALTGGNVAKLADSGIEINDKNVFMSSFLGRNGGPRFLTAMAKNPAAPADQFATAAQVEANPHIFYTKTGAPRSLQQVYNMETANFGAGNTTGFDGGTAANAGPAYSPGDAAHSPAGAAYPPPNVQPPTYTWTGQSAQAGPPIQPSNVLAQLPPVQRNPVQPQPAPQRTASATPVVLPPSFLGPPQPSATPPRPNGGASPSAGARVPDQVMSGRALLAKYLGYGRQTRSA